MVCFYGHPSLLRKRLSVPFCLLRTNLLGRGCVAVDAQMALTTQCPPCVTFRLVVVSLRGPRQSPVLPFACCAGLLLSVGRCGRCSCWCRFRVRGAQWLVCRGCAGCGMVPPPPPPQQMQMQVTSRTLQTSRIAFRCHKCANTCST